jgi:uncharacterized protein with HEPN domain
MNPLEQLERKTRLWHVERAAADVAEFTSGKTIEDFTSDRVLQLAVERQIITIGEALKRAVDVDPELISAISDVRAIITCRHRFVHNYPQIDDDEIWRIIQNDLPRLLAEVRALLPSPPAP